MSHQVQLSPAASHCRTAVLDPAGTPLSHRPAAADGRTPRPDMRRILSHLGNPICTAIVYTRQRFPGDPGTGKAGPVRAVLPRSAGRPESREDGSGARTPRATGPPHYLPSHPGSALPASLMTAVDLPSTPHL